MAGVFANGCSGFVLKKAVDMAAFFGFLSLKIFL
jgi:hypothetical protein